VRRSDRLFTMPGVFLILGLPWWVPIVGTLVGMLGGFVLGLMIRHVLFHVMDSIAYRIYWVDLNAEDVLLLIPFLGPPVLTIATSLVLLLTMT
jgi:hypothetical protein